MMFHLCLFLEIHLSYFLNFDLCHFLKFHFLVSNIHDGSEHVGTVVFPLVWIDHASVCVQHRRPGAVERSTEAVHANKRSALDARADGELEGLSEVLGHEGVHDGVDAAVHVGQEKEGEAHVAQPAVVQGLDDAERRQHVVDDDRSPAHEENEDDDHQHQNNLAYKRNN